jgi:hypothetical protein
MDDFLLPEIRSLIRVLLPSFARIQMQRINKLCYREDKDFVLPKCLIPPAPLIVKQHPDVRGALLELLDPLNKDFLNWIISLPGENNTRVYPSHAKDRWDWYLEFPRSFRCIVFSDSTWRISNSAYPSLENLWRSEGPSLKKNCTQYPKKEGALREEDQLVYIFDV